MELPPKPPQILPPDIHAEKLQELRHKVNNLVDQYLSQDPRPSLSDFAEVFGANEYIEVDKKRKATIVRVGEFKESIVQKIWNAKKDKKTVGEGTLPQGFHMLDMTILPPDEQEVRPGNGGGMEKKEYIPRTQYLGEILEEFGESFEIIGGKNTEDMMRTRTYFIFFLEKSKVAIFVNNEEGNATFVFHDVVTLENALYLAQLTKQKLKEGEVHEFPIHQINWNGNKEAWQEEVLEGMTILPNKKTNEAKSHKQSPLHPTVPEEEKIEDTHKGWMTIKEMAKILKKAESWVKRNIRDHIKKNESLAGKEMPDKHHRIYQHYPPELFDILKKEIETLPAKASEDSLTMGKLRTITKKGRKWLKKEIAKIIEEKPELCAVELMADDGQVNEHYPSQLLVEVQKKIDKLPEKRQDNWFTVKRLEGILKKSKEWIETNIKEIPESKLPINGKMMLVLGGPRMHYSKEILALLQEKKDKLPEKKQDDSLSIRGIAKAISKSEDWVRSEIAKVIQANPELDGKLLLDDGNREIKMYPPDLIEIIRREAEILPKPAPENWATLKKLEKIIGKDRDWIENRIVKIVEANPNLEGKDYLTEKNNIKRKHYPPELIEILKQKARE